MPIKRKNCAGQVVLFYSGHSGGVIYEKFCSRCSNYIDSHCNLLDFFKLTCKQEKVYPKEWIYDDLGWPSCSEFQSAEEPEATTRCAYTLDMFGGAV